VLVLATCCLSLLIVGLDNTIVNIALPAIQAEFDASISGLQWTIDAYTVVLASLLMLSGSVADRFGRRRVFQIGLTVFTVGSLLCSLAPDIGTLVVFRMVQAVGGSMLNPVAVSIITNTFTKPAERARAIGVWGATVGVGMALGPVVGGTLINVLDWRAIFWINIPIGLTALLLAALFVPESKAATARRPDLVGQFLVVVALAALIYGLIEGPVAGWGSARILGSFALAAAATGYLLRYESRRQEPLLDLRFFRSAPFSGATVMAVAGFAAMSSYLFLNTLYLQNVRGFSALQAGLCTLPMAVMTVLGATLSGRLVGSRGPRLPLLIAGTTMTVSGALLTGLSDDTALGLLIASYLAFGIGFGMLNAPVTNAAVSGMPRAQAGVAAAIASTSRQVGQALGIAVVGSVVISHVDGPLATGFSVASQVGWWIVFGCGVAVLLVGILTTGRWAQATAETVAAELAAERTTSGTGRTPITTDAH
jgi:EmrB/QacA subfamily drug resistance transporter